MCFIDGQFFLTNNVQAMLSEGIPFHQFIIHYKDVLNEAGLNPSINYYIDTYMFALQ